MKTMIKMVAALFAGVAIEVFGAEDGAADWQAAVKFDYCGLTDGIQPENPLVLPGSGVGRYFPDAGALAESRRFWAALIRFERAFQTDDADAWRAAVKEVRAILAEQRRECLKAAGGYSPRLYLDNLDSFLYAVERQTETPNGAGRWLSMSTVGAVLSADLFDRNLAAVKNGSVSIEALSRRFDFRNLLLVGVAVSDCQRKYAYRARKFSDIDLPEGLSAWVAKKGVALNWVGNDWLLRIGSSVDGVSRSRCIPQIAVTVRSGCFVLDELELSSNYAALRKAVFGEGLMTDGLSLSVRSGQVVAKLASSSLSARKRNQTLVSREASRTSIPEFSCSSYHKTPQDNVRRDV